MAENGSAPGTGEAKRSAAAPADPEVVDRPLRRRFSPSYKLRIVEEADRCTEPGEVGQVLRREGLYSSHLTTWRKAAHSGSLKALSKKRGRVAAFAIALASLTSLAFGLLPALKSIGRDINDTLRQASPRSSSGRGLNLVRGGLVVGEVALSLVLVTLAGLLMRSFMEVTNQDSGFEAENVWVLQLNPTGIETPEDYSRRMDAIERSLALIPGVTSVSYGIEAPFEWTGGDQCCWSTDVALHQAETEMVRASVHPVSDGFFETYGTRLVAGSGWSSLDAANEPTPLVISEQLAVRIHGSADAALGREFGDGSVSGFIQGVAEPTLYYGLDQSHENGVYMPVEALPFPIDRAVFGLRTAGNAEGLVRQIREAVWAVEAELPVPEVALMTQWVDESSATRRFGSALSPRSES